MSSKSRVRSRRAKSMSARPRNKIGNRMKAAVKKLTAVRRLGKKKKIDRLPRGRVAHSSDPYVDEDIDDVPAEFIITPKKVRDRRKSTRKDNNDNNNNNNNNSNSNDTEYEAKVLEKARTLDQAAARSLSQQIGANKYAAHLNHLEKSNSTPVIHNDVDVVQQQNVRPYTPRMNRLYRSTSEILTSDGDISNSTLSKTATNDKTQTTFSFISPSLANTTTTAAASSSFVSPSLANNTTMTGTIAPEEEEALTKSIQAVEAAQNENSWLVNSDDPTPVLSVEALKLHDQLIDRRCTTCQKVFDTVEAMQEHYIKCSEEEIECPKKCEDDFGEITILKRKDIQSHLTKVCLNSLIECPYFREGCCHQFVRGNMDAHMFEYVEKHLQIHLSMLPGSTNVNEEEDPMLKEILSKYQTLYRVEDEPTNVLGRNDQLIYENGLHAHEAGDYVIACTCFEQLALSGHAESQYRLGVYAGTGLGSFRDAQMANNYFLFAAKQGHERAQVALGMAFYKGDGVLKDLERACFWIRKACQKQNVRAMCVLGGMYAVGQNPLKRNYNLAMKWYLRAALKNSARAFNAAAKLIRKQASNKKLSAHDLEKKAFHLFLYAAMKLSDPEAHVNVGLCFEAGAGVDVDAYKAVDHYRVAALEFQLPRGISRLANCYLHGIGTEKNVTKALRMFRTAQLLGDPFASKVVTKYASMMQAVPSNITQPMGISPQLINSPPNSPTKRQQQISSPQNKTVQSPQHQPQHQPQLSNAKYLKATVVQGRNLVALDSNGKSDPFCKLVLLDANGKEVGKSQKTAVVKKNCENPEWNETFTDWQVAPDVMTGIVRQGKLQVVVWDHDRISSNDFMGMAWLNLNHLKLNNLQFQWVQLKARPNKNDRVSGEICIAIELS